VIVFVVLLVIVAVIAGGVAVGAVLNKRSFARQNEIVPGSKTRAPAAWAGAHTPEALLHRRLKSAVDSARTQLGRSAGAFDDVVAAIARGAQEIDERLIAAATLAAPYRAKAVGDLEPSVAALEAAVAGIGGSAGSLDSDAISSALADANQRLDSINSARAEVEAADRSSLPPPRQAARPRPAEGPETP
jgi:hypothetical protein